MLVALLLCTLPASRAMATGESLAEGFWPKHSSGSCWAEAGFGGLDLMTPDARSYRMSIELRALREMVLLKAAQRSAEAPSIGGCEGDGGGQDVRGDVEALCAEPDEALRAPEELFEFDDFVAASLLEEIAPLERIPAPRLSCHASSSDPDRCESYPAHPERLHLELASSGAVHRDRPLLVPPASARSRTLALERAHARRAVGPASGHGRALERPPQAPAALSV